MIVKEPAVLLEECPSWMDHRNTRQDLLPKEKELGSLH